MNVNLLTRIFTLFTALGLTACATVGPTYKQPELSVPAGWNRLEQSANADAKAVATGDLSRWWVALNDRLLSQLVEEALSASPDLRSAKARLRQARAAGSIASAGRYPSVTASGSASRVASSEEAGSGASVNMFSAGLDATWEADLFGGVRRGIEAADADLASTEASLQDTRVSLVAEVALNYVEARTLQIRLGIARDNLASQTETLQLTKWRAQAGLVSTLDVEQARSNVEQTRAQVPALADSLSRAEHSLDILLGKTPGTLHARLSTDGALPSVPREIAVGIPADTLRQRPDVRSAERKLAAETARVGVAEAARYPSFTISGSIGLEALTLGAIGRSGAATSSLLGGIAAPVFNAGRLKSRVEQQDAVREQAEASYEKSVLNALQEVEDGLVSLALSRERGEALDTAVRSARNAAELARQRYSAGLTDFQVVLDTERSVLLVEDSLASTRADTVLSVIRLYKALGGGWTPQKESIAQKEKL